MGGLAILLTFVPAWVGCGKEDPKPPPAGENEPSMVVVRSEEPAPAEATAVEPPSPAASSPAPATVSTSQVSPPPPPASPATRASVPAFTPLADAVQGEWALYEALERRSLRYEVVRVGGVAVTVRLRIFQNGKPLGLPILREELRDHDPMALQAGTDATDRRVTPARITAAGRDWNALLYEDRWEDEEVQYVRRTWASADAPVFGLIRMELRGDGELEARLELKGFGKPDGKMERRSDGEKER